MLGGPGDDLLVGMGGRDLLIGGTGSDRLVGNADDDLLIAGTTLFDLDEMALARIQAEWTSSRAYAVRVANLRGTGTGPRDNGNSFLIVDGTARTVVDDGDRDTLTGEAGKDWFLLNLDGDNEASKDKVTDLASVEFAGDLDFIVGP